MYAGTKKPEAYNFFLPGKIGRNQAHCLIEDLTYGGMLLYLEEDALNLRESSMVE
jgi:hypothetical protein